MPQVGADPLTERGAVTVMRVHEPGGRLTAQRVGTTPPPAGHVRIDVAATGVCHADISTAQARGRSTTFPVTPGHEIAGTIAELGAGVAGREVGDRVAVGWFGGSCGHCRYCRGGDVVHCADRRIPGLHYPGGWAQSITVPADALAAIPEGMDLFDAAPMGCAGVSTFNAIRNARIPAGATVAVFGLGGLGHLAVQFAAALGHRVVAIARGPERRDLARALGAHEYIDSRAHPPGEVLASLGGADLILSTAPTTEPVSELARGLAVHGRLSVLGVDGGDITVPAAQLMMRGHIITGHLTGSPRDTEEAMRFAHAHGIVPMVERMGLTEAQAALARIVAGEPRFRIVLDTSH